jgi:hypothetical protein
MHCRQTRDVLFQHVCICKGFMHIFFLNSLFLHTNLNAYVDMSHISIADFGTSGEGAIDGRISKAASKPAPTQTFKAPASDNIFSDSAHLLGGGSASTSSWNPISLTTYQVYFDVDTSDILHSECPMVPVTSRQNLPQNNMSMCECDDRDNVFAHTSTEGVSKRG